MSNVFLATLLYASLFTAQPYVATYAAQYGVDEGVVNCIIAAESEWDAGAVGDDGKAVGLAQFHLDTWGWMRGMMGESTADLRAEPREAIKTLCWALANGYGEHWTTYRKGCGRGA